MNDRYLFKAKRIDNGKWTYGFLYGIWERRYILWGMTNNVPNMVEVDPSTICQCTGLKDKAGTLIWENDVVTRDDFVGVVKFGHCKCNETENIGFYIDWSNARYYRQDLGYWFNKISVIGSVFDNPELLEVE